MQKWLSGSWWLRKGRELRQMHLPRAYRWLKSQRLRHINLALAVLFAFGGALLIAYVAARVLAPRLNVGTEPTPPADLTRLALTIAAGAGGVVALVVAYRRQRDLEQGRFTEAFGAAAKQLGDADVAVRLAGVYAMAGVADQTSKLQRQQCIDVLCGYLRLPYSPELGNNHQTALVVRKPVLRKGGSEQELEFQYRQNDKVVRQTIVRIITAHLQPKAPQSWTSNNFDFTGSHFEEASFEDVTFSGKKTWFAGATFSGKAVTFHRTTFSGEVVSFTDATFSSEYIWFGGATFSSGATSFEGAIFSGDYIWFADATFSGKRTSFDGAIFSGKRTSFDGAIFSGEKIGFAAIFSGDDTSFDGATFSGKSTSFHKVDFGVGRVTFYDPKAWKPAPVFDWAEKGDGVGRPPENVQPQNWPPPVAKE